MEDSIQQEKPPQVEEEMPTQMVTVGREELETYISAKIEEAVLRDREEQKKNTSEYDKYEAAMGLPVLLTEQDHAAWLATPDVKRKLNNFVDVLSKDLKTAYLSDPYIAWLMGEEISVAREFINHGMPRVALADLVDISAKLALFSSVKGKETILQRHPNITFSSEMPAIEEMKQDQEMNPDKKKGFMGRFNG